MFVPGGDTLLKIDATFSFGEFVDEATGAKGPYPFRTLCMLIALLAQVLVSLIAHWLFTKRVLPLGADVCGSFAYNEITGERIFKHFYTSGKKGCE